MFNVITSSPVCNRLPLVAAYRLYGWTHLHPILPPMQPPEGPALDEKAAKRWAAWFGGKCPGVMDGWDRWYPVSVQRAGVHAEIEDVSAKLHHEARRAWAHGAGLGVLGRLWPAIDVDVVDRVAADRLAVLLRHRFGEGCFLRVGRFPKFLMPFRLGDDAIGLRKMRIAAGSVGAIEVLASGQQWVLEGTHGGTGRPYTWQPRERAGRAWRPVPAKMPVLGLEALEELLRAMAAVVGAKAAKVRTQHEEPPRPVEELAGPEELVREVLARWVNGPAVGRDTWVGVGHALVGASRWGLDWDGRELFGRWSAGHPDGSAAADERLWASIKETRLGVDWLIGRVPDATAGDRVGWLARLSTWRMEQGLGAETEAETETTEQAGETP